MAQLLHHLHQTHGNPGSSWSYQKGMQRIKEISFVCSRNFKKNWRAMTKYPVATWTLPLGRTLTLYLEQNTICINEFVRTTKYLLRWVKCGCKYNKSLPRCLYGSMPIAATCPLKHTLWGMLVTRTKTSFAPPMALTILQCIVGPYFKKLWQHLQEPSTKQNDKCIKFYCNWDWSSTGV